MQHNIIHQRVIHVSGRFALFSNPAFRADRFSYPVPTYSGLRGMAHNIFFKPEIGVDVLAVRVLKKPAFTTQGFNHIQTSGEVRLSEQTYLLNTEYLVCIGLYQVMPGDIHTTLGKYSNMLDRAIKSGGRRIPYLGCSECKCDISFATKDWDAYESELEGVDEFGPIFHHHDKDTNNFHFIKNCVAQDGTIDFAKQSLMEVTQ